MDVETSINSWYTTHGGSERVESLGTEHSFVTQNLYVMPESETLPFRLTAPEQPFSRVAEIGRGGMGQVFRARQHILARDVALKTLHPDKRADHAAARSFLAEARVHGRLEHPNIVPVYDLQVDASGELGLAMKLVSGRSWHEHRRAGPAPELVDELEILLAVCNAVAFAHSRGILHNDLKPANIMLGSFGEVLVMDWGLAASFQDDTGLEGIPHVSSLTDGCGTPAFAPPELIGGAHELLGPASDVYLLGGILYLLLTGRAPHVGDTVRAAITVACLGKIKPLPEAVPDELAAVCRRALSLEPCDRYPTVADFRAALQQYLRHRESLGITEQAQATLESCQGVSAQLSVDERTQLYTGYAEAVAGFAQACRLWADNHAARQGEERARLAWAGAALRWGDLHLAETQAHLLDAGAAADLNTRIAAEHARRSREVRARRRLRVGFSLALVAIFAVVLLYWRREVAHRRDSEQKNVELSQRALEIEAQRAEVAAERDRAQLRGGVAQRALKGLTERVFDLFRDAGDARSQQAAREILRFALREWSALRATRPAGFQASRAEAEAHLRMAELRFEVEVGVDGAIAELEAAADILRQLHPTEPESTAVRGQLLRALTYLQHGWANAGDLDAVVRTDRELASLQALPSGTSALDSLAFSLRGARDRARNAASQGEARAAESAIAQLVTLSEALLAASLAADVDAHKASAALERASSFFAGLGFADREDRCRERALALCQQAIAADSLCGLLPRAAKLLIFRRNRGNQQRDPDAVAQARAELASLVRAALARSPGGNLAQVKLALELHDLGHALMLGLRPLPPGPGDPEQADPERAWAAASFDASHKLYLRLHTAYPENQWWFAWRIETLRDLLSLHIDPETQRLRIDAILPELERLLAAEQPLLAQSQVLAVRLGEFAKSLQGMGRTEQAQHLQQRRVDLQRRIFAQQQALLADHEGDAELLARVMQDIFGISAWESPDSAMAGALTDMAWGQLQSGAVGDALDALEEALQLLRAGNASDLSVSTMLFNYGYTLWQQGHPAAAAMLDEAAALSVRCLADPELGVDLGTAVRESLLLMAGVFEQQGRRDASQTLLEACHESLQTAIRLPTEAAPGWQMLQQALAPALPVSSQVHCQYFHLAIRLGRLKASAQQLPASVEVLEHALQHARELVARQPDSEHQLQHLLDCLVTLRAVAWEEGLEHWRPYAEELVDGARRYEQLAQGTYRTGESVTGASADLAWMLRARGDEAAARAVLEAQVAELLRLIASYPESSALAEFQGTWQLLDAAMTESGWDGLARQTAAQLLAALGLRIPEGELPSAELVELLEALDRRRTGD